jgi:phage tail-like protein
MTDAFEHRLKIKGPETAWEYKIPEGAAVIGRQVGNDLHLEHPQISRKHARLDTTSQKCTITDLNSSNGTYINNEKATPEVSTRLSAGDIIKIGPFTLVFEQILIEVPATPEKPATRELPPKPALEEVIVGEEPHPLQTTDKPEEPAKEPVPEPASKKPPPEPPEPPPDLFPEGMPEDAIIPPGLSTHSTRLLNYLPDIYHTDFMSRFLGLFESIFLPIEWNIDNFDLYLSPGSTPGEFISWFSNLFKLTFDDTWGEEQRRSFLLDAHRIYARRGTHWALSRVLEIYTGTTPEIVDQDEKLDPFTFRVRLPLTKKQTNPELIEALIDSHKPAHTTYQLRFKSR